MAGIYIHIPFCRQACYYCNFHFSTSLVLQNDFKAALLKEIELRTSYLHSEKVETIYFGGGTPSLLPPNDIKEILEVIYSEFNISSLPEITLEANPDDMDLNKLLAWKLAGINRLSIGIQSFFSEDLLNMNRAHDAEQAVRSIQDARIAGFNEFSLDLIYGSPGLTNYQWKKNLEKAIVLDPAHLSCYALTVEPKTALYKMIQQKKTADVEPDVQASQFLEGIELLEAAGYEHYEISNFAKPGKRSRHNSAYWQSKKYLGLGPSAHSFDGISRQWNISNNSLYIQSLKVGHLNFESETLHRTDKLNEYIMTSLRTMEGIDLKYVEKIFGKEEGGKIENKSMEFIQAKKMKRTEEKLILTKEGKLFADGIAAALFFD